MMLIDHIRRWWDGDMQTDEALRLVLALRGRLEQRWRAEHGK